ncbi:putative membrane protein [Anseongella ginsenosidimutans]|uniref:Putative membrane protein n=1 Tax=Anseongella ginsenosidimutans TaxID=496056 RepID=A0A4R3KWL8_9SPHI|nr:vitamin K epoxide reductase family protein [Anseongella ginsenosidimutans]QEC51479.1 hypothetical protein FRZ59_03340 [Anseongella ginsenosidimutans]TCS89808.1 putative membrane protein [Anseongella ginsenosidimutans]
MIPFIDRLLYPTSNVNHVAWYYARLLGLKVTRESLRETLEGHPDYPSMLALSDAFGSFGVGTTAVRISKGQLAGLEQPYITQIKLDKGSSPLDFTVVRLDSTRGISYLHPVRNKWITCTIDEFASMAGNVVFIAEVKENAGEMDYQKKQKAVHSASILRTVIMAIVPILVLAAIALGLFRYGVDAVFPGIYLLLAAIGSFVGLLLLWHEVDRHNPALKQACSDIKNVNCGAVLGSSAARLLGLSWSHIGFAYFAGIVIVLLISGLGNLSLLQLLSWLGLPAVGYTVFSLYYQWRVAKQWCTLCLVVQCILVLQAAVILTAGWAFTPADGFPDYEALALCTSSILPFIGVTLAVPTLQQAKKGMTLRHQLQRLKHNSQIFSALLDKQKAAVGSEGLGISLGNPRAKHRIIKVCNPYCSPCAKAHPVIEKILDSNSEVQVQIIFTATCDDKDKRAAPVRHLLAISSQGDKQQLKQALDDWYLAKKKDYFTFAANYPMNSELQQQGHKIEAMRKWCEQMDIRFTPTFFVDGHQLPEMYSVEDLNYFLKS